MNQTVDLRQLPPELLTLAQREQYLRMALSAFLVPKIRNARTADYADYETRRVMFDRVRRAVQDFETELLETLVENSSANTDGLVDAMRGRNDEGSNISGWLMNKADVSGVWGP